MGNCCRYFQLGIRRGSPNVNRKQITLLTVGLDGSGKTTVARRLSGEPVETVVPTVGFSTVSLQQKGCLVTLYDLGGGVSIRDIWRRYYADVHGVIFVVDAADSSRMAESRRALESLLQHPAIAGKPLLLLANKQDVDGALDEIDVVEKLDVEALVNRQKCPTLVELCSARQTSKKMDVGIENGYKWLLRCIIKDYPSLNNRVLLDMARQAEADRIAVAAREERLRVKREGREKERVDLPGEVRGDPFKPIQTIVGNGKLQHNGIAHHLESMERFQQSLATIPGIVEEGETSGSSGRVGEAVHGGGGRYQRVLGEGDGDLLRKVGERSGSFLIRPKSSGARMYQSKSDSDCTKSRKRKKLKKNNRTGPSPFTDISPTNGPIPKIFDPSYDTEITVIAPDNEDGLEMTEKPAEEAQKPWKDPFIVVETFERRKSLPGNVEQPDMDMFRAKSSKSMPNSRKNSGKTMRKIPEMNGNAGDGFSRFRKLPPLNLSGKSTKEEVLLDVTQLEFDQIV